MGRKKTGAMMLPAILTGILSAQSFTSNITGVVTDPNDAVIAGAEVTATNLNTRETRRVRTNDLGRYTFSQLLPAAYSIRVLKEGFREYIRTGVEVGASRTLEINARLELGQLSQAVEVSAAAPVIDTQTADRSVTVDDDVLKELPLTTRNVVSLVHNRAGVVTPTDTFADETFDQNHNRFSMNGGRETSAQILIDGVPAVAGFWGGAMVSPGAGSVQAMQIITRTYDTQYGKSSGGVMNITTRGGTQAYRGSAFGSLQNDNLNANGFFSNLNGVKKSESKRNQFGATFAGPIWKTRKLYGQFGYEGLRQTLPASVWTTVPTAQERSGDFSGKRVPLRGEYVVQQIFDPLTTRPDPANPGRYVRDAFPGNRIPSGRFDKVGSNVLRYFPEANRPGDPNTNALNFYRDGVMRSVNDRYDFRVDWSRSERHTLFGRMSAAPQTRTPPNFFANPFDTGVDHVQSRYNVNLVNTFMVTPTLVVNVLVGGSRWVENQVSKGLGFDSRTLGWSSQTTALFDIDTTPQFFVSGLPTLGNSRLLRSAYTVYNAQLNATREYRAHSVKFGMAWEASRQGRIDARSPTFSIDNLATRGPDPDLSTSVFGSGAASLLLGLGAWGSLPTGFFPAGNDVTWAWYLQDAWKVNRRLTVNYGVRHDLQRPRTERFNRLNYVDPGIPNPIGQKMGRTDLYGGIVFVGADGRYAWQPPYRDFAPRVSLALKLTDKLVFRSGFGVFFMRTANTAPTSSATGFTSTTPWLATIDQGRTFKDPLSNPFPNGLVPARGTADGLLTSVGSSVAGFFRHRPTPYMQEYSADFQYQLTANNAVALGYFGSGGRRLSWGKDFQFNSLPSGKRGPATRQLVDNPFYGVITTPGVLSQRQIERGRLLLPYPHFTALAALDQPGATSNYHSLTASFVRRFRQGFMVEAEYIFAKSIDNASANVSWFNMDTGARDWYDMAADRSVSSFDVPHAASVTFLYNLPVGKGRWLGGGMNGILDAVLGGWSVSGTQKFQSGQPARFTAPNNAYCYGCTQYPNVSDRALLKLAGRDRDHWFNTSVFSMPADYTIGNTPRYVAEVRNHHMNNLNLAVAKAYRIREKVRVQFRAEGLNAFNRVRFGFPRTDYSPSATVFGRVLGAYNLPRIIQLTLRAEF